MGPSDVSAALKTHSRRQEVIAELGQQALETTDIDNLMSTASRAVADTLDVSYCKVLELGPSREEGSLRAGVGWREGLVGSADVPTTPDSVAGYTIMTGEPVIVEDVRTDTRFSAPELLTSHDIVGGINVLIGSEEAPWGVLGAHTTDRREFTEHDAAFVQNAANILASAINTKERERELERTQDLLKKTEGIADVGGWEIDPETEEVFWSEQIFDVLNVDADEEPPLEDILEMYVEEDRDAVEAAIGEAIRNRDPFDIEARIHTDNGEVRWLHVQGVPETEDGEVVTLRGAAQDITERKERELDLVQYQTLTEAANDVIITIDSESTIRSINPAVSDVFGYDEAELVGEPLTVLMPDDLAERHLAGIERYLETGERNLDWDYLELAGIHADGSEIPLAVSFSEIRFESERFFTGIIRDITERREYVESVKRFQTFLEHSTDLFTVLDRDGTFLYQSPSAEWILGYEPEELLGENAFEYIHPDDRAHAKEEFERGVANEEGSTLEVRFRHANGSWRWLESRGNNQLDNPAIEGFVVNSRDITERKEYEQKLETSHEHLEQFAAAVSHDLKEPLGMVTSYLQLLERRYEERLDEEGEEFIDFAVDGASRMREMIEGLISEYARVESGGEPLQPLDLEEVFADVCADLERMIERNDAEITTESLPRVEGDPTQLRQLFQNLLDNAIKYSGEEPPEIHVSATREEGMWKISVSDNGIGIDSDATDAVFDVFYQLHADDEQYPGTGIGLSLCERIVQRHGGEIWVESEVGEGSTFYFTLVPASDREPNDA